MVKHILSLREFTGDELAALVEKAIEIKTHPDKFTESCRGKGLLLLMEKTSTRTALAFAAGIAELGGYSVRLNWDESNFTISPLRYEARYVSSNSDVIMARLKTFESLSELANHSRVPVLNGCDTRHHPSQALTDLMTIREVAGGFDDVSVAFVGVHNNVANSLVAGATRVGVKVGLVTPEVHKPAWDPELMDEARATGLVTTYGSVAEAAAKSDFIYTDTWVDMEFFTDPDYAAERDRRVALMSPFQLNAENFGAARPWVMHDMPIHPGYEISAELVEDRRSIIFQQAENRLYTAKAMLLDVL